MFLRRNNTSAAENNHNSHQFPEATIDAIRSGSNIDALAIALGVEQGKYIPFGYDKTKSYILEDPRNTRPIYAVWLLAEAAAEGRTEEAEADFPSARKLSDRYQDLLSNLYPEQVNQVEEDLKKLPNYNQEPKKITRLQKLFGKAAVSLVNGTENIKQRFKKDFNRISEDFKNAAFENQLNIIFENLSNNSIQRRSLGNYIGATALCIFTGIGAAQLSKKYEFSPTKALTYAAIGGLAIGIASKYARRRIQPKPCF